MTLEKLPGFVECAKGLGVDAFLVGGSLLLTADYDAFLKTLKSHSGKVPLILFPGGIQQVSAQADALLFLSLLSGRNADHIIGTQVLAAPIIHRLQLEPISTAYLLVESGRTTAAEFMSGTTPLPRHKPEIAMVVLAENAGEGSTVAAPMFRQILEHYYGLEITPLPEAPQATE